MSSGRVRGTRGLTLLSIEKLNSFLSGLIIDECLNDQLTRQKKAMISRANAGRISETLFDHLLILSQINQSVCA